MNELDKQKHRLAVLKEILDANDAGSGDTFSACLGTEQARVLQDIHDDLLLVVNAAEMPIFGAGGKCYGR